MPNPPRRNKPNNKTNRKQTMNTQSAPEPTQENPTPVEIVHIELTREETELARSLLKRQDADPRLEELPLVKTARFTTCPGLEADIKCVNASSPYVDPVLFRDNQQVDCGCVAESLEGSYQFEHEGNHYMVEILPAKEKENNP
jgi:hypothetical protein